eukprot:6491851-Amphidinium_carterae.1
MCSSSILGPALCIHTTVPSSTFKLAVMGCRSQASSSSDLQMGHMCVEARTSSYTPVGCTCWCGRCPTMQLRRMVVGE